ncbi:hypothetical protein DPMN_149159 [Dreissena polymorpha]|uniref:Uncharacterized protein n=1 Tax=Dreissena polymorpha TaxID=45954 RepID=A0A9D4J4G7_DREPO|nr:hypothetical protein DPMN_149159 [Dreissena polymorpha]
MWVFCPRENMPAPLVDLHEGDVQHLPATNLEVYGRVNKVSKGRKPVASFKKPRLDPQDGTERSMGKVRSCYNFFSMIWGVRCEKGLYVCV